MFFRFLYTENAPEMDVSVVDTVRDIALCGFLFHERGVFGALVKKLHLLKSILRLIVSFCGFDERKGQRGAIFYGVSPLGLDVVMQKRLWSQLEVRLWALQNC